MLATDTIERKPIAGALVTGESEEETTFFLQTLKDWLPKPVKFMTIDFSARLESGVKAVFPSAIMQKCVFHAVQLLTRGLGKEFIRVKNQYLLAHIKEWQELGRVTRVLEKKEEKEITPSLFFTDTRYAWDIYQKLREILSKKNPRDIQTSLFHFFSRSLFIKWAGKEGFRQKYDVIFNKSKFKFSEKALKYVIPMIFKAWRATIRDFRFELEDSKLHFNKIRYLVLMNPLNMSSYNLKKLRKSLQEFPWLRTYRKTIVKFYYQFRLAPGKRSSLKFLSRLITEDSHIWLKSAIQTLIKNEEQIFRFQHIPEINTKGELYKAVKVVNESSNKLVNQLYRVQCGMRTLPNLRMRISHRLKCPIIISPTLLEKSQKFSFSRCLNNRIVRIKRH